MGQVDSLEALYQKHRDIAEFYVIYIREAHAADSSWPVAYATKQNINQPTTFRERCDVAHTLIRDKRLTIPCLVDDMDNKVDAAYQGHPTRLYVIDLDGALAVAGASGPAGLRPALNDAQVWLREYRQSR